MRKVVWKRSELELKATSGKQGPQLCQLSLYKRCSPTSLQQTGVSLLDVRPRS